MTFLPNKSWFPLLAMLIDVDWVWNVCNVPNEALLTLAIAKLIIRDRMAAAVALRANPDQGLVSPSGNPTRLGPLDQSSSRVSVRSIVPKAKTGGSLNRELTLWITQFCFRLDTRYLRLKAFDGAIDRCTFRPLVWPEYCLSKQLLNLCLSLQQTYDLPLADT